MEKKYVITKINKKTVEALREFAQNSDFEDLEVINAMRYIVEYTEECIASFHFPGLDPKDEMIEAEIRAAMDKRFRIVE